MHITPTSTQHQRNRVAHYSRSCDSYSYFNLLTSDTLFEHVESLLPTHRERQYPPTETLSLFLAQAMNSDRSCQNIVNQTAVERIIGGLPQVSTHTGGYCRARKRLPKQMVESLTVQLGALIDESSPTEWRWRDRRVCLIDGTTVSMPDTPDNQLRFPKHRGQKEGLGFPICRIVGVTSLSTGALLNAAIGRFNGKGSSEQTLLRQIVDTFNRGDIVMGDAFFPTWFFIADMQSKGIDILMEQLGARKKVTDFRKGKRLGKRDHLISLTKPKCKPDWMSQQDYDSAPEQVTIREFKTGGKTIVTTMICPKSAPKLELKTLYKSRWNVELDLRSIKETLGTATNELTPKGFTTGIFSVHDSNNNKIVERSIFGPYITELYLPAGEYSIDLECSGSSGSAFPKLNVTIEKLKYYELTCETAGTKKAWLTGVELITALKGNIKEVKK